MAQIAITATSPREAAPYAASIESRGGQTKIVVPKRFTSLDDAMEGVSGLVLCGGYDVHPSYYGQEPLDGVGAESFYPDRDEMELAMLRHALEKEMPVYGICRGMQVINVCFGGTLLQDFPGHRNPDLEQDPSIQHQVYVSPGSKLGAIIGAGAFYRTNSLHHQGVKEATRAPSLMASSFQPDDGMVEGLESPEHRWLIGVQCHPERETEVAKTFLTIWSWLVGWAERYEAGDME